jgi:hypothetical protein
VTASRDGRRTDVLSHEVATVNSHVLAYGRRQAISSAENNTDQIAEIEIACASDVAKSRTDDAVPEIKSLEYLFGKDVLKERVTEKREERDRS